MTDDDLDAALAVVNEPEPEREALVPLADRLMAILRDTRLQEIDLARADQRADAVEAFEILTTLASQLSAKAGIIKRLVTRYMVEEGTRKLYVELPAGRQAVTYEPPKNSYVVSGNDGAAMHKELTALVDAGVVTAEEVELAVKPVISYVVNHTHLNALVRRSERAAAIVDKYRRLEKRDPLEGRVTFPKG